MVSQPDPVSLTIRGAASVVSRASARTRRYNRSHAGGSNSLIQQNEFPVFSHSGDVDILIRAGPAEKRYLLHRHTLTQCSGFFEASTSHEWSRTQPLLPGGTELARIGEDLPPTAAASSMLSSSSSTTASSASPTRNGNGDELGAAVKKRWKYELDPGLGDGDIPMLVQRDEPESIFGGAAHKSALRPFHSAKVQFSRSVISLGGVQPPLSQAEQDLLRDYDNLFRIFYNYPPVLDGINVADAYVQCKSLLTLADQYDALAVVGPRVDHHLLQFQSRLWRQIAKYPISYLRLGFLARSRVIFQEALVHVVGQWPAGERSLRATMPAMVLDIIEDKVDELEETVSRVEGRLFRLNLQTPRGERVGPNNNYLDWLAMSLFRQWLADNTTPQPGPESRGPSHHHHHHHHRGTSRDSRGQQHPPPTLNAVGRAYRTLGSASAPFLTHDECKRFLKLTPELYSRDNLKRFEKRMDELKAMARSVVRPLMNSGLELDLGGSRASEGINYLTCTEIGNRDLPWPMDE